MFSESIQNYTLTDYITIIQNDQYKHLLNIHEYPPMYYFYS